MSVLGLESDRKLFMPEEINFPKAYVNLIASPDHCYEDGDIAKSSLLHQILRGGTKSSLYSKHEEMMGSARKMQRYDSRTKMQPKRKIHDSTSLTM